MRAEKIQPIFRGRDRKRDEKLPMDRLMIETLGDALHEDKVRKTAEKLRPAKGTLRVDFSKGRTLEEQRWADTLDGLAEAEKARAGIASLDERRAQAQKTQTRKEAVTPSPQPKLIWEESPTDVAQAMYHQMGALFSHDFHSATDDELEEGIAKVRRDLEREMRAEAKAKGASKGNEIRILLDDAETLLRKSLGFVDTSIPGYKPQPQAVPETTSSAKKFDSRMAAHLEAALDKWERDAAHPPEFILAYSDTMRRATKELRVLETAQAGAPTDEFGLGSILDKNPFQNPLYPDNARTQWDAFRSRMEVYLMNRGGKERDVAIEWGLARYKELLREGRKFLEQVNREEMGELVRNPRFQNDFADGLFEKRKQ